MYLPQPLSVVAAGLASSVGSRRATACAAIRAGITRAIATTELGTVDPKSLELVPLVAHPIQPLAEGFYRLGRWLRLACSSLEDLRQDGGPELDESRAWSATSVIVVTR